MWIRLSCFSAGIGVCYALLILVGFRHQRQQRKAVPFNAKMMESHFSLEEGVYHYRSDG